MSSVSACSVQVRMSAMTWTGTATKAPPRWGFAELRPPPPLPPHTHPHARVWYCRPPGVYQTAASGTGVPAPRDDQRVVYLGTDFQSFHALLLSEYQSLEGPGARTQPPPPRPLKPCSPGHPRAYIAHVYFCTAVRTILNQWIEIRGLYFFLVIVYVVSHYIDIIFLPFINIFISVIIIVDLVITYLLYLHTYVRSHTYTYAHKPIPTRTQWVSELWFNVVSATEAISSIWLIKIRLTLLCRHSSEFYDNVDLSI